MPTEADYIQNLIQSRQEKDERIRQNPRSWMALIGLHWLQPGKNTVGSADGKSIQIPEMQPHQELDLFLEDAGVRFMASPKKDFLLHGEPASNDPLHSDQDPKPDILQVGSLSFMIIVRGEHTLLRVWDSACEQVQQFTGLRYFPIRPDYCIQAKYHAFSEPIQRITQNAIGNEEESTFSGEVLFTWQNTECRLMAQEDEDELLLNFTDLTRADLTYPAGRYLTIPVPDGEEVILDFNLAVNWPCAYTPYATCPLPIRENTLPVRIEAGEMRYHLD